MDDVHNRMTGIMATGSARADASLLAKDIAELPFALVPCAWTVELAMRTE